MKPIIFCLEDFEVHRFMLEFKLLELVGQKAEVVYFSSMKQLKANQGKCDLLIADLNLGDSDSDQTAAFLREFCLHTPVLVQSTEQALPQELEEETEGRIVATEKAGHGERFSNAIQTFMQQFEDHLSLSRNMK
jgi:DNA-binding NarL/FixJ family response regulator